MRMFDYRSAKTSRVADVSVRARHRETDPRDLKLSPEVPKSIWSHFLSLYETGMHPAMSLCVRVHGQVLVEGSVGNLRPGAEKPVVASPDSLFQFFSATKAITATLIHVLDQNQTLHYDDPVCHYLPAFAKHNKHKVTIQHLISHTAGLPELGLSPEDAHLLADPQSVVAQLCEAKLKYKPGQRLAYHAMSSGFLLAEIVKVATGKSINQVLKSELLNKIGLGHLSYIFDLNHKPQLAENLYTGGPHPWPISKIIKTALGTDLLQATEFSNQDNFLTTINPSANMTGSANDLCQFFQFLLEEQVSQKHGILDRGTLKRMLIERRRFEPDATLWLPIRYSQGFMLGSEYVNFFGRDTGQAFGHLGLSSIVAYADPERDISVALLNSGKSFAHHGLYRWAKLLYHISHVLKPVKKHTL